MSNQTRKVFSWYVLYLADQTEDDTNKPTFWVAFAAKIGREQLRE